MAKSLKPIVLNPEISEFISGVQLAIEDYEQMLFDIEQFAWKNQNSSDIGRVELIGILEHVRSLRLVMEGIAGKKVRTYSFEG